MTALLEPCMVIAVLLNFYILSVSRLKMLIVVVAIQGVILGLMYPIVHQGFAPTAEAGLDLIPLVRLLALTIAIIAIKGSLIPVMLNRAVLLADIRSTVTSVIGFVPSLLIGGVGAAIVFVFAQQLPVSPDHHSPLLIPTSLTTVLTGFLILVTRREALAQVLGYIVMENGIFIFGLLLIEAVPILVELGVVLDLFVGVFVMGIIVHHVSRAFPEASTEHLASLKEL
ncbi:MAG: hydrogenase [Planctomycetota bacterium]|nr:MAG: hydrogenase [Planctomycetota bacterium]